MTMTCKEWRAAVPKDEVHDWNGRIYMLREADHEYMTYDPTEDIKHAGNLLKLHNNLSARLAYIRRNGLANELA